VPDELFDALADFLDQRQIVELTATVGTYNLVSRFLVALQIDVADRQLT
jgi:alkylhydroperoxidase family enzyme